ncbi:hypothetical protein RCL_jg17301.t1 [Rhizophagus clarus]|uniref:Uncharacterized protein n=1 Tax=Rhizophagus clarus TaxID=94130 RepID=A0A8H3KXC9_9GLOM|nr:hypothetical protein RCL_jg17301.t1 [Rhizophagus clarus]
MFFRALIRDTAINERLAAYSLLPRSITAFGSVSPWLLCTVIAHTRVRGICKREHATILIFQERQIGIIETTFLPLVDIIAEPSISSTVPTEPLTSPVSTNKLVLSITHAPLDNNNWASRPFAVSETALEASLPPV